MPVVLNVRVKWLTHVVLLGGLMEHHTQEVGSHWRM